jgi:hypothetical protein
MTSDYTPDDQADSLGTARPEPARWGLGRVLRLATGVREDALAMVPSEYARYTSMGGVVAGTAVMAMLSMAAALYWVFGGFQPFILVAVPVWGLFILSLDRWLMSSTSVGHTGQAARKLLPRLLLSIALGVVLAEPLLLGVYNTAINERVSKDRQEELTTREARLRVCNPVPGTPEADKPEAKDPGCRDYLLSLGGDSPAALQSQLNDLTTQKTTLKESYDKDATAYADLEEKARLECNGTSGPGLTGRFGEGINCRRLRTEADQYRSDHHIDENGAKLKDLEDQINTLNTRLGDARNNYAAAVNTAIEKDLAEVKGRQGKVGLLERFRTLDELVSENGYVRVTQWAIRIFFILVDALPVILKVLTGTTSYDRIIDERLGRQERVEKMRSDEELSGQARRGDLVRYDTEKRFRVQRERIDEHHRIELGNHDERRGELIDALENHLLRTATGLAVTSWESEDVPRVVDGDFADAPTQELPTDDVRGGYR